MKSMYFKPIMITFKKTLVFKMKNEKLKNRKKSYKY